MEESHSTFGDELRRRRDELGMTLTELASRVPCSTSHLSKVERNLVPASRKFAVACDKELSADGELVSLITSEIAKKTAGRKMSAFVGLPAAPARFVGRSQELARITEFVTEPASTVCLLSGMAGAGKTALALRAAWNVADAFSDGCFYFDFDAEVSDEGRAGVSDVLDSLLRLLGVPEGEMPSRTDAQANLWRSLVRGKSLLLVLDNIRSSADLDSLLPAGSGCKLIVTCRKRLNAFTEAVHVAVGPLEEREADELFRAVGGERAVQAADSGVGAVVERCGRLPLAVHVAAARFRGVPDRTVEELGEALSQETYRLSLLDDGERSVAAALKVSCDGLNAEQRRLLALLGLIPAQSADPRGVVALVGLEHLHVRMLVDGLVDAHLVARDTSSRITTHDLVRQFAKQALLVAIPVEERYAAVRRLLEHSLRFAVAADKILTPQRYRPPVVLDDFPGEPVWFDDREAALAWLDSEWRGLVALCRTAAEWGMHSLCWQLAFAMREFFYLTKRWGPWIETHLAAVESARIAGARPWLAISLGNLGVAHADRGDLTMALDFHRQSLDLYQEMGDEHGIVNAISNVAWAEMYLGDYGKALDGLRKAMDHYRRLGNRRNAAIALRGIALLEAEFDLCPAAVKHAKEAEEEFHSLGLELDIVMSINCAAWARFRSGEYDAARAGYKEALTRAERCGSRYEMARALTGLGNIHQASGEREQAVELWARADALYGGLEPVMLGEARVRMAG